MTTESRGKSEGVYVMPDEFSFGLEERADKEPEITPGETASPKLPEENAKPVCMHKWEALAKELQTLDDEGKTIWQCRSCGNKTNTYSWDKP